MEEKKVVEQEAKEEVRKLTEPELEKVVGGRDSRINPPKDEEAGLKLHDGMSFNIRNFSPSAK